jgi:hypothetical protein
MNWIQGRGRASILAPSRSHAPLKQVDEHMHSALAKLLQTCLQIQQTDSSQSSMSASLAAETLHEEDNTRQEHGGKNQHGITTPQDAGGQRTEMLSAALAEMKSEKKIVVFKDSIAEAQGQEDWQVSEDVSVDMLTKLPLEISKLGTVVFPCTLQCGCRI